MSGRRPFPWGELARLAVLAAVAILPRVLFLDADPPGDLHLHFITDEGWWAHNARQAALFGHWIMDDHNPPLWSTPAYSFLLWLVYRVLGVGLYQTRLLSGLAGAFGCFAVYGFLRREAGPRRAFLAALLLAVGYFPLGNSRVAFTETVQSAFAIVAVLAALRSRDAPAWGVASAAGLLLALLCKPSAIPVGLVIGALYATLLAAARRRPAELAIRRRATLVFAAAAAVGAALIALFYVIPHWPAVRGEFVSNTLIAINPDLPTGGGLRQLLWYGYRSQPGARPVLGGFFLQEPLLVLSVALLACARLLARARGAAGPLEQCCWWWIVLTLAFLSVQSYQPDRRFLLLVPPFAILLALAVGEAGARTGDGPRVGAWRRLGAWAVLGLAIGLYLRPLALPVLLAWTRRVTLGAEAGISPSVLLLGLWPGAFVLAALLVWAWAGHPALRRAAPPAGLLLAAALVADVAHDAAYFTHLRFSIRDVSREIGRLAAQLPADRRAMVGNTSDTLALETGLFSFVIRDWGFARMYMNLDGLRRFRPGLAAVTTIHGAPVGGDEGFRTAGMRVVRVFDYWPDDAGRARLRTTLYEVAPPAR